MIFRRKIEHYNYNLTSKVDFYYDLFLKKDISEVSIMCKEQDIKHLLFTNLEHWRFEKGQASLTDFNSYLHLQQIVSELGHLTKTWEVDWHFIYHVIERDYLNIEIVRYIDNSSRKNTPKLYKEIPIKYHPMGEQLYLRNLETREPKLFEVATMKNYGSGLNISQKKWKPNIGVSLYEGMSGMFWDNASIKIYKEGTIWNPEKQTFVVDRSNRKSTNRAKVKVTINGKTRYV